MGHDCFCPKSNVRATNWDVRPSNFRTLKGCDTDTEHFLTATSADYPTGHRNGKEL
jgi:hypothetical protein